MFDDILGEKEVKEKTNKNNSQSKDLDIKIMKFLKVIKENCLFVADKIKKQTKEEFLNVMEDIYDDRENFIQECIDPIIDEIDEIRKKMNNKGA